MAPPPWLPPLNSHDHYSVSEVLTPESPKYQASNSNTDVFLIKTIVSVKFKSEEINTKQRSFEGLRYEREFKFGCPLVDSSLQFSTWTREKMFPEIFIPIELDIDNLVEKIRNFACCMRQKTPECYNFLPFRLQITKEVKIPEPELEAWNSWYDVKVLVDPSFEIEYKNAISRPRTYEELVYGTTLAFKAASESCVDRLKKVNLDDNDDSSSRNPCAICFEELKSQGSGLIMATVLPCSHVFHGDCILQWLKVGHFCPVYRFELPSVDKNCGRSSCLHSKTIFICSLVFLAFVFCAATIVVIRIK